MRELANIRYANNSKIESIIQNPNSLIDDFSLYDVISIFGTMNVYRFLLLITILLCGANTAFAQRTEEDEYVESEKKEETQTKIPFKKRLVFGGNLGGSFGTYSYFQINPMVGYKTTDWWVNGIGVNYIYSGSRGYSQHVYGASVWSRAYIYKSIMLHTEYEYLTMNLRTPYGETFSANAPVWLVGGGYQNTAGGIGFGVLILFDLIQHYNSPYANPIIRIGGMIGF